MPGFLQNRWWTVGASVSGLMVGAGAMNIFAWSVFLKPVSEDLGISRGTFGLGLAIGSLAIAISSPIFGHLIERWGLKAIMLPGIVMYALIKAGFAFLTPSIAFIIFLFVIEDIFGAVQSPIGYAKCVSMWFDKERGLALGIAMAGVGLGAAVIPKLSAALIAGFGWRTAYVGLGIAIFVFAFLPVALFIREPPAAKEAHPDSALQRGFTVEEALKGSWRFWALTVAFFLGVMAINGTITHIVALLTDRGVPIGAAVGAVQVAGLAIIVGRIASGYCVDRLFGPYVAIVFFISPMIGIALLASGAAGIVPLAGAVLCGMGIGAEVDLMAFFVSRYFGLKAFGKIYGWMFGVFTIGTGVGPWLSGVSHDVYGSYTPIFLVYEVALAITCLLFLRLGPYAFPAAHDPLHSPRGSAITA